MADTSDYAVAGAGGLGGLLAGAQLADSDAANNLLVRLMTRNAPRAGRPDFRVPVYAGADQLLSHGSGEAVMASRISKMLKRHGVGSYYVNTSGRLKPNESAGWHSPEVARNSRLWSDQAEISGGNLANLRRMRVDIGGKDRNAFSLLMSTLREQGLSPREALRRIRSGAFDGFTVGELLDTFKVDNNIGPILSGKMQVMPQSTFRRNFPAGRVPYALTGEAGMNYNTLEWGNAAPIVGDSYPFRSAPGTRNLSLDTQFQANYRAVGDKLLPGSGMPDPGFGRRSRLARLWQYYAPKALGGGGRAEYREAIDNVLRRANIDPKTVPAGTKYMLISTGAAGANAAEKLRLAEMAFKNDPNVRILLQYGKKNPAPASAGLDMYTNNGLMEEITRINKERPGFVIAFDRDPAYKTLAKNVDLHGIYGGSSSLTEALGATNPTIEMTDTHLNRGNNAYGRARRGFKQVDSGRIAVGRVADSGKDLDKTIINTRDRNLAGGSYTLRDALKDYGRADVAREEQEAVKALRDAMYKSKGKFSRESVEAANRMLAERNARDRSFIRTVRDMVLKAIDKNDASRYSAMRPGVGKAFTGLQRGLFRTAAGRRIGLPLALASALGLGSGAVALTRKLKDRRS